MMFVLCDDTSTVLGNHLVLSHHSTAATHTTYTVLRILLFIVVRRNIFHAILFLSKIDSFSGKL